MKNILIYRTLQLISLLLGIRVFVLMFLTFALYVFTFFLISRDDITSTFFDIKIHGIVLCSIISIAAGGLINQFYDKEKDKIVKPFRSQFQSFIKQKYILYFYLILNVLSLGISLFLSWRIFLFFLFYQFLIWFYSHKLSKKLLINNLSYVLLSVYPFFGVLIYYQHFSFYIFCISFFLFLLILSIDIAKDLMTIQGDKILEYNTLPIVFGENKTIWIVKKLMGMNIISSGIILWVKNWDVFSHYFVASIFLFGGVIISKSVNYFILLNTLKIWVFIGVVSMLLNALL